MARRVRRFDKPSLLFQDRFLSKIKMDSNWGEWQGRSVLQHFAIQASDALVHFCDKVDTS